MAEGSVITIKLRFYLFGKLHVLVVIMHSVIAEMVRFTSAHVPPIILNRDRPVRRVGWTLMQVESMGHGLVATKTEKPISQAEAWYAIECLKASKKE